MTRTINSTANLVAAKNNNIDATFKHDDIERLVCLCSGVKSTSKEDGTPNSSDEAFEALTLKFRENMGNIHWGFDDMSVGQTEISLDVNRKLKGAWLAGIQQRFDAAEVSYFTLLCRNVRSSTAGFRSEDLCSFDLVRLRADTAQEEGTSITLTPEEVQTFQIVFCRNAFIDQRS
ncbi:hypothetical protein N431DRAFT_451933 [Stipitochalara longipes BDJ]|nr:hypothetical protein N431DRAFT_451933 [Stipitochalara longipes BDJ]